MLMCVCEGDRWLETAAKPKLRDKSYESYKSLLRRYIRPVLGERILSAVTPLDVQERISENDRLRSVGSHRSLHPFRSSLRHPPSHPVATPGAGSHRRRPATPASTDGRCGFSVQSSPGHSCRRYSRLTTDRFLRSLSPPACGQANTWRLKWQDIDWVRGTVSVVRTLEKVSGGWHFAETKRARSRRIIKCQDWVLETLKNLQARTIRWSGCSRPDKPELVFTSPAGHPIYSDKLAKRFKAILGHNGLPIIRLYDLRHTAATLALSAGVPPKVVAEQLGHASAAFTLDVYSHLLPHMQEEAAIKVEQILAGPGLLPHRMAGQKRFPKTGFKRPPNAINPARERKRTRLRA